MPGTPTLNPPLSEPMARATSRASAAPPRSVRISSSRSTCPSLSQKTMNRSPRARAVPISATSRFMSRSMEGGGSTGSRIAAGASCPGAVSSRRRNAASRCSASEGGRTRDSAGSAPAPARFLASRTSSHRRARTRTPPSGSRIRASAVGGSVSRRARRSTSPAVSELRSATGRTSTLSRGSVERCVSASKRRTDSTSSPQSSIRSGAGCPNGNRSTIPPRIA